MATPPTFIADNEGGSGWDANGTSQTTAAFNSAVGDVWVTGIIGESDGTDANTPTNTGTAQTFTPRGAVDTATYTEIETWTTVVADTLTSQTVGATTPDSTEKWNLNCVRFSGSDGIGAAPAGVAEADNASASLDITTTGDNSAIVVFIGDWDAGDGTSRTWLTVNSITPTVGNGFELTYFRNASNYSVYIAYYPDAGAAGTKSVGLSAPTGANKYSIVAIEVLGTGGGGPAPEDDAGPFPTVPTSGGSRILSSANLSPAGTHTFPNLSSLTKSAGDLLIAIICQYDGNSTNAEFSSWGGGFQEFVDQATTTTMAIGAAYKWSTGAETGTFTVTSADTSTNDSQCLLLSIAGADKSTPPEGGAIANGTGAAANPGSLNPAGWDAENTLWIAVAGAGEDTTTGSFTAPSAAPTNYTGLFATTVSADVVGGVYGAVAFRQVNAASEDPGGFTVDVTNARNSALLLAVRPEKYLILPMRRDMELPPQLMVSVR